MREIKENEELYVWYNEDFGFEAYAAPPPNCGTTRDTPQIPNKLNLTTVIVLSFFDKDLPASVSVA